MKVNICHWIIGDRWSCIHLFRNRLICHNTCMSLHLMVASTKLDRNSFKCTQMQYRRDAQCASLALSWITKRPSEVRWAAAEKTRGALKYALIGGALRYALIHREPANSARSQKEFWSNFPMPIFEEMILNYAFWGSFWDEKINSEEKNFWDRTPKGTK